jgi:DNA repair protein RadA/Sms
VRPVAHAGLRLKEAAKLGFGKAFTPAPPRGDGEAVRITASPIDSVASLIALIASSAVEAKSGRAGAPARGRVTN